MPDVTQIDLQLSKQEALVLFAFLSRFSARQDLRIEDQSESRVLWDLCAKLERILPEPLRPDYESLLLEARRVVRDALENE